MDRRMKAYTAALGPPQHARRRGLVPGALARPLAAGTAALSKSARAFRWRRLYGAPSSRRALATPSSKAGFWSHSESQRTWMPKPSPSANRIEATASGSA